MPAEWLSVRETAERLHLTQDTITRHLRAGTLPCRAARIGRTWRIAAEDVASLGTDLHTMVASDDSTVNASTLAAYLRQP